MASLKGGDKLAAKLRELSDKVSQPATLQVGFLDDAQYPDGTPVAMVAFIDEYGRPGIGQPPRPFFRDMIRQKQAGWPDALATILVKTDYDATAALNIFGVGVEEQLQESIRDFNSVPLKPSTIKRKGFDKQLIDTAYMLNSVGKRIVK